MRGRLDRGFCYYITRLFKSDEAAKIAHEKKFDNYQSEKLQRDLVELSKFANKLKKEQKSNMVVISNANHKM